MYSLSARTMHILNDNFYQDKPNVRFGIIDYGEEEILKETLWAFNSGIIVLKDGMIYYNNVMQDAYHLVYELVERKIPEGDVKEAYAVRGRLTVPGLYMTYWKRELLAG